MNNNNNNRSMQKELNEDQIIKIIAFTSQFNLFNTF